MVYSASNYNDLGCKAVVSVPEVSPRRSREPQSLGRGRRKILLTVPGFNEPLETGPPATR